MAHLIARVTADSARSIEDIVALVPDKVSVVGRVEPGAVHEGAGVGVLLSVVALLAVALLQPAAASRGRLVGARTRKTGTTVAGIAAGFVGSGRTF